MLFFVEYDCDHSLFATPSCPNLSITPSRPAPHSNACLHSNRRCQLPFRTIALCESPERTAFKTRTIGVLPIHRELSINRLCVSCERRGFKPLTMVVKKVSLVPLDTINPVDKTSLQPSEGIFLERYIVRGRLSPCIGAYCIHPHFSPVVVHPHFFS